MSRVELLVEMREFASGILEEEAAADGRRVFCDCALEGPAAFDTGAEGVTEGCAEEGDGLG